MNRPFVSIRAKMMLLCCLLITAPFALSGLFVFQRYSEQIERDSAAFTRQITDQLAINLDRYIRDLDRVTLGLFYDSDVMRVLRSHRHSSGTNGYVPAGETYDMNQYMSSLVIDQTEIEGIFIFTNDGHLFSNLQETVKNRWDDTETSWMREAKSRNGALTVVPPTVAGYYTGEARPMLSIARHILDPTTGEGLGYVKVDLSDRSVERILRTVDLSENGKVYILNKKSEVLYPFGTGGAAPGIATDRSDDRYLTSASEVDYADLTVVGVIPRTDLNEGPRELTRYTLVISAVAVTVASLIAIVTSDRLVKPIRYLQKKMRAVEQGILNEPAAVRTHDEIGQLTESFNRMISRLDEYVKTVYESQLREQEARLSALQSQIHPHFLYNTLEAIRMHALKDRNDALSSVIESLGRLLRYTVDRNERHVALREELEFLEHYLDIQKFRLDDKLSYAFHVDVTYEDCVVPKLVLQPLAENAIEHGMGDGPLSITVAAFVVEDDLLVTVTDDGKGMSAERLRDVESRLREPRSETGARRGVALRNIHQRLQILYGPNYGLVVDKRRKRGTSIAIRLPLRWGGDEG